jgi:cysteinyl-tRNA synthetase
LKSVFKTYIEDVLGLRLAADDGANTEKFAGAIDLLLNIRMQAKANKDWATSDKIRNELAALGFNVKDTKDGFEWSL